MDNWIRGLEPTEVMILAGPPGAGKSAVGWKAAQLFAERQMPKDPDKRIGTLVLSLEMSEKLSAQRTAQAVTSIDGGKLREGKTDDDDLATIIKEWRSRRDIPLWFNFTKRLTA